MVTEIDRNVPGRIEREFMRVFEFPSGKVLSEMPLGESYKLRVDFSADGKLIAMGDTEQQVTLRETDSGNVVKAFAPKLASQLISIAVSPDGKYLAASDREPGDLYIWETSQGKLLHTIKGEEISKRGASGHAHGALRFSPDGRFLADGRWDATLVIDVSKGSIEASLKGDFPSQVQWSADGGKITVIGSVSIHDPPTPLGHDNSYPSVRVWFWRAGTVDNVSQ
jgi:WD40 repeat protein